MSVLLRQPHGFKRFAFEPPGQQWKAQKRIERFPSASSRSLLLAEHGGLSISPHLRPDVVERTGADTYSVEKVPLSAGANYEFASQNAHLWFLPPYKRDCGRFANETLTGGLGDSRFYERL